MLDSHRAIERRQIPCEVWLVRSPLRSRIDYWRENIHAVEPQLAHYVIQGIEHGFRVGFTYGQQLRPARRNLPSVAHHSNVVETYLREEVELGRVMGPFLPGDFPQVQVNRFGVIPKSTPGKWRLIVDLSYPTSMSVNDGINPAYCSLQYTSVERVAKAVFECGVGALMAKVDVKSAYRLIPVHPEDRHLLGMVWQGQLYIDAMLPFGLRSAPVIYTAVADAFEMILKAKGVTGIDHYVDDIITFGPPRSVICQENLVRIVEEGKKLGITMAPEKTVGPSTCLVFLGIEVNSVTQTLRLPQEKLSKLRLMLTQWEGKRSCTRRELESLIGYLSHACKVIRPGRTFLRYLIALLKVAHRPYHHVRISKGCQADLKWWSVFAWRWNGVSFCPVERSPVASMVSDASGSWGCAAVCRECWFQVQWTEGCKENHIAWKELLPIIIAAVLWGKQWRGMKLLAYCDNEAVVSMIHSRSSPDSRVMHLLRCLFFIEASYDFVLTACHIAGRSNYLADALSRNKLASFYTEFPQADRNPTPIPGCLLQLLMDPDLEWTSPSWTNRFIASLDSV